MHIDTLSAHIESVLFATEKPMSRKSLETLFNVSRVEIDEAIEHLSGALEGRGITLIETDNEITLRTTPQASAYITKMRNDELSQELGKAGIETLAIILYRGGAYRSEIDWIRGVCSSATIRTLSMRGLIEGTPDAHNKRKIRYRPTIDVLAHLGITRIEELPRYDELMRALSNSVETSEVTMLS
ncbi:MAG TPA: SMC-Scp complex subunit ScpB [Candidatus Kaiserbacteria bacterium]|nr:SMC-Scp complex subunit ScpB [Candidatus Kaiserbacteria bacterium]